MTIIDFLSSPILPESVKTWPSGYSDWPPVWVVLFFGLVMFIVMKFSGWDDVDD